MEEVKVTYTVRDLKSEELEILHFVKCTIWLRDFSCSSLWSLYITNIVSRSAQTPFTGSTAELILVTLNSLSHYMTEGYRVVYLTFFLLQLIQLPSCSRLLSLLNLLFFFFFNIYSAFSPPKFTVHLLSVIHNLHVLACLDGVSSALVYQLQMDILSFFWIWAKASEWTQVITLNDSQRYTIADILGS